LPSIGPAPFQELVLVPARPLLPGRYEVTVSNLLNISMQPGGGGQAEFEIRPPPPVESPPVRRDTSASVRTRQR
jgi:hypothetical protein